MKNRFVFVSILYLFIAGFFIYQSKILSPCEKIFTEEFENESELENEGEMNEALLQEIEKTKDPALGYVPSDRLLEAYEYLNHFATLKTTAAIPGINWQERGPNNVGGRCRTILFDKNDITNKTVWTAGVGGGLWKTTDITATPVSWTKINDFFGNIAITTIAQDPTNPNIMYFGTGEGCLSGSSVKGLGIWKSIDGGATWALLASTNASLNTSDFYYTQKIVVNSGGKIFAATRGFFTNRGGIMMSSNGGTTWTKFTGNGTILTPNWPDDAADVELDNNGDVYASFSLGGSDGIYKSTNAGTSWTSIYTNSSARRIELACAPNATGVIYALLENNASRGLLSVVKSVDGGTTWINCTAPVDLDATIGTDITRGQAWYDLAIAIDPNDANTCIIGGVDLFRTTNGGSTWTQISKWSNNSPLNTLTCSIVHADQHAVVYAPGSSNTAMFANDGGVFFTNSASTAATSNVIIDKNFGLNITQFYSCAAHPTSGSNYFLAGAQDNGTQKFNAAGISSTTAVVGGDGAFCHIDQDNPTYQFASYVYQVIYRSTNGGASFSNISNVQNKGSFINPSDYDNTANILYAGDNAGNYFRMTNATAVTPTSSSVPVAAFGAGTVTNVSVSANTPNRVFFGFNNKKVFRVDNADTSPIATDITGTTFPTGSISCISVGGSDDTLLVTFSNYGVISVWYTVNANTATPTWVNVEGNLPDMPVRWAMLYPGNSKQAFLATELGVWSTDLLNGGTTNWAPTNSGLANVRVDMLQFRASDKTIVAATHGRGLFTAALPLVSLPVTWLDFTGKSSGSNNIINWSLAMEINNQKFEVQRSTNGVNFKTIGEINGAGNSSTTTKYSYSDETSEKYCYYRIKQVDYNGKFSYSKVIYLEKDEMNEEKTNVVLFPNPVKDLLTIKFNNIINEKVNVSIYSLSSHLIHSSIFECYNTIILQDNYINSLEPGIYLIEVKTANSKITKRFIKT